MVFALLIPGNEKWKHSNSTCSEYPCSLCRLFVCYMANTTMMINVIAGTKCGHLLIDIFWITSRMMSKGTIKDIGFMLVVGLIVLAVLFIVLIKMKILLNLYKWKLLKMKTYYHRFGKKFMPYHLLVIFYLLVVIAGIIYKILK